MAIYTKTNQAVSGTPNGNIGEQTMTYKVPEVGEVFIINQDPQVLAYRNDQGVQQVKYIDYFAQNYPGVQITEKLPDGRIQTNAGELGFSNDRSIASWVAQDIAKKQGIDINNLSYYDPGDIQQALGGVGGTYDVSGWQYNPNITQNTTPIELASTNTIAPSPGHVAPKEVSVGSNGVPESKYFYSGAQLRSNANPNAVNALYQHYFDRDAKKEELDNWTNQPVQQLEDFLQAEQQKYNYTSKFQESQGGLMQMPDAGVGVIDSNLLKDTTTIDTSGIQSGIYTSEPAEAVFASSVETSKAIQDYINMLTMPETQVSGEYSDLLNEVNQLMGESAGQTEMYNNKLNELGVTQMKANLTSINNEIAIRTATLQKRLAELGTSPMTASRLSGSEAAANRVYQSDIMFLQAQAQAAMNNIAFAQEQAQAAVDAKYNPILESLNIKTQQLSILEGQLDKEEERYIKALNLYLEQRQADIEEAKQKETNINNIVLEVITANPAISNDRIIDQIRGAGSAIEAAQIAAPLLTGGWTYVTSPAELTQYKQAGYEITQVNGRSYARPMTYDEPSLVGGASTGYYQFNPQTGKYQQVISPTSSTTPSQTSAGIVTDASGASYDIASYATDPNHESAVQSILNNIGQMTSWEQMDEYIQLVAPGSPVTGEMIGRAAEKHGVSWEAMMAIMQQDSNFGTAGAGARSFNPGNVGNTETATSTGQLVNYGSWQAGVDAVAKNLAWRKVSGASDLSSRAQAVYNNPLLINQYTSTEKGKIIDEIANAGLDTSSLVGKALSDTAIKEIAQTQDALDALNDLAQKVKDNVRYIGPLSGWQKINPWSKARQIQADIDRIRQTVGKALEGGVLRKEDEEKYKKILATITDTPETAEYKITQLIADISSNLKNYVELQGLSGRYIDESILPKSSNATLNDEDAYQIYLQETNK